MCLYPRIIKNPKYKENQKNRGVVPPVLDKRTLYVPIGCGNCMECRKQKARAWQVRLLEDLKEHKNGKFITLTFSNESIKELAEELDGRKGYELDNAIARLAVRRFTERWRKKHKKAVRHWLITELGHTGTKNVHVHGIIWTNETIDEIRKQWKYGYIWPRPETTKKNYVSEATVNYIIKYVTKIDIEHKHYKAKILTSKGIGKNYVTRHDARKNKYNGEETNETYRTSTGHKISMPTYWRNKIYTDEEREQLWIQKLNKEERWVCGEKIDISKNYEEYWKQVEWYRRINKKLGYGQLEYKDEEYWNREQYEKELRQILIETRIKKSIT